MKLRSHRWRIWLLPSCPPPLSLIYKGDSETQQSKALNGATLPLPQTHSSVLKCHLFLKPTIFTATPLGFTKVKWGSNEYSTSQIWFDIYPETVQQGQETGGDDFREKGFQKYLNEVSVWLKLKHPQPQKRSGYRSKVGKCPPVTANGNQSAPSQLLSFRHKRKKHLNKHLHPK